MAIAKGLRVRPGLVIDVRRLRDLSDHLKDGLREAVKTNTARLCAGAKSRVPRRTGATHAAIKYTFFDDGMTGSVYVDRIRDERSGKLRPAKFPVMLEFGTVTSPPRPFLLPALEAYWPQFQRDCNAVLDSAPKE